MPGLKRRDRRELPYDDPPSWSWGWINPRYDKDLPAVTAMSRRKKRLVERAIKHNKTNRFLNLPGEIRDNIHALVLGRDKILENIWPYHYLPKNGFYNEHGLEGILGACKQLRAKGLATFYKNNSLFLQYNLARHIKKHPSIRVTSDLMMDQRPEEEAQARIEPLGEILTPKIAFQASRHLEMRTEVRIFTQLACYWHAVGIALVVRGDEYSCRVLFEQCDDNDTCQAMMASLVPVARADFIGQYLEKMRGADGTMARDMRLVGDDRIDSPRYPKDQIRKYYKDTFYTDYPWFLPQ